MILSKFWVCTALCSLLAMPFSFSQNLLNAPATTKAVPQPSIAKWSFGLRGGVGSFQTAKFRRNNQFVYYNGSPVTLTDQGMQYYLGGYATRHFNERWSLRSELSILSNPGINAGVSLGLFPRYKLVRWLSLEAGIEARQMFSGNSPQSSNAWLGVALTGKNVEFHARFSPGYTPGNKFLKGGWSSALQIGMSVNLGKKGRVYIGK